MSEFLADFLCWRFYLKILLQSQFQLLLLSIPISLSLSLLILRCSSFKQDTPPFLAFMCFHISLTIFFSFILFLTTKIFLSLSSQRDLKLSTTPIKYLSFQKGLYQSKKLKRWHSFIRSLKILHPATKGFIKGGLS